jgi:hypothetical protein
VVKNADGKRMLDSWMLRTAFVQLQLHAACQSRLLVSPSQDTLNDAALAMWIGAVTNHIGRRGLTRGVIFETGSNALLADHAQAVSNIERLRHAFGFLLPQSPNVALFEIRARKAGFEYVCLRFDGPGNTDEVQSDVITAAIAAAKGANPHISLVHARHSTRCVLNHGYCHAFRPHHAL